MFISSEDQTELIPGVIPVKPNIQEEIRAEAVISKEIILGVTNQSFDC